MNYMPEIAKMLGVEIGEEFRVRHADGDISSSTYRITEYSLNEIEGDKVRPYCYDILTALLNGADSVVKLSKPILDDEEKKYLSRYIKPWRDKVVNIIKAPWGSEYAYINIRYYDDLIQWTTYTSLPTFKKDTMYKGMELEKEYTLEDLGI